MATGDVTSPLGEAYEQSFLYSDHTFGPAGPNMGPWNSHTPRYLYGAEWKAAYAKGAYKAYEEVINAKRAYAHKEAEIVNRELKSRLDLLAKSVDTTDTLGLAKGIAIAFTLPHQQPLIIHKLK